MGLFGELDANDVNENPFYVADGNYQSVLTELVLRESNNGEGRGLSFNWTVEEEESEFNESRISEWIGVWLDSEEGDVVTMRRDRARTKSRLMQIGMSADEMNELVDDEGHLNEDLASQYIGTVAFVSVKNSKDKNFAENGKTYTNISKVALPE